MKRIRELRRSQRRTSNLYDRLFTRRVSIYVTAALLPLGVTPNAVSMLNTLVGLTAWGLIAFETHPLLGVLLIHAYAVLDSVDGELARTTQRYSLQGLFLEDHSAYLMINGYWIAMGVYLSRAFGSVWPSLACVALVAFGRSAMPAARRALLKSVETGRPLTDTGRDGVTTGSMTELGGIARRMFVDLLHPANVWAVSTTVLAVEVLFVGSHYGLLVVTAVYYLLSVVREVAVFRRLAFSDALDLELAGIYSRAVRLPEAEADAMVLAGDPPISESTSG